MTMMRVKNTGEIVYLVAVIPRVGVKHGCGQKANAIVLREYAKNPEANRTPFEQQTNYYSCQMPFGSLEPAVKHLDFTQAEAESQNEREGGKDAPESLPQKGKGSRKALIQKRFEANRERFKVSKEFAKVATKKSNIPKRSAGCPS